MKTADLEILYRFNAWANHKLLDAAATLSSEELMRDLRSSSPSVHGTLLHIMWSEWVWLERWNGRSPRRNDLPPDELADARAIATRWLPIVEDQRRFIGTLRDDDLSSRIRYVNFAGETREYTLERTLQHVVNHSTYHRGQIVTMLRQLGRKPPSTDLLLYFDDVDASTAAVPSTGADRPAR